MLHPPLDYVTLSGLRHYQLSNRGCTCWYPKSHTSAATIELPNSTGRWQWFVVCITATLAAGYTSGTSFTGAACNCRRSFAVNANLLSWATLIKHCLKRKHESNRTEYQSLAVASAQPWCCQISVNQIWMVSWHLVGFSWRLKPAQNWILQSSHLPICLLHYAIAFRKILDTQSQSLETRDNVAIFGIMILNVARSTWETVNSKTSPETVQESLCSPLDGGRAICWDEDTTNHEQSKAGCHKNTTEMNLEQQIHANANTYSLIPITKKVNKYFVVAFQWDLFVMLPKVQHSNNLLQNLVVFPQGSIQFVLVSSWICQRIGTTQARLSNTCQQ